MNIIFGKWHEEVIYDDHGGHCPCRTDYWTTFKTGNVQFVAEFSDLNNAVHVYHEHRHVVTIYNDERLTTDKAEELIRATLLKDSHFLKFAKDKTFAQLGELNKSLYQKLLADTGD